MVHGDFKDLTGRTTSDKTSRDKGFNIAKNPKYEGYQRDLASMVDKGFDQKVSAMHANKFAGGTVKNEIVSDKELAEELQKQFIRKFKKWKVYSSFIDNISGADLTDMELASQFNKVIYFSVNTNGLLCLKNKKGTTITNFKRI